MRKRTQKRSKQSNSPPVVDHKSERNREPPPVWDRRTWLVAIPLALIAIVAFIPVLDNGFVEWDDSENFVDNPYFRGLGMAQLKWAWSTLWVGVYQPLAWMLFGAQYTIWKLDPRGFHLTSALFHALNTVVLYVLTVTLLVRCRPDYYVKNPWSCALGAGLATAVFAVHPLRVEAVAWASCQPYLPCALFAMLAVLAYLHAFPMDSSPRWSWFVGSFVLFVAAQLFKAPAVTLPAVLLILDVYPLRRFGIGPGSWFGPAARRALLEKAPFILVSLIFMGIAMVAKPQSRNTIEYFEPSARVAQACFGTWFYIVKTALPLDLIPLYPFPKSMHWLAPRFLSSIIGALAMTIGLILLRRRWPALLAAWLTYLVILAPTSGLVRISAQITADRYSYIAMVGFVVLAAAGFCRLWQMSLQARPATILMSTLSLVTLLGLCSMTWNQCRIWHDSERFWNYALRHGAGSNGWMAHGNLALGLNREGKYEAAAHHFAEAARLNPNDGNVCNNHAMILASCPEATCRDGKRAVQAANRACELTDWRKPDYVDTLAAAYAESGDFDAAVKWQTKAMEMITDERNKEVFRSRLVLYRVRKPYREPFHGPALTEASP
jgi:protein O-mannosyl-transferase